MFRGLKLL
jgi:hypothetical protein